ncbi:MAG: hypothetical protein ACYC0Q_05935 [Eubacteriales bacterium]
MSKAALKLEPKFDKPVFAMVDGQVVVNRLDEVGSFGYQAMTAPEVEAEREWEEREYWLRWRHNLQQEQQGGRA